MPSGAVLQPTNGCRGRCRCRYTLFSETACRNAGKRVGASMKPRPEPSLGSQRPPLRLWAARRSVHPAWSLPYRAQVVVANHAESVVIGATRRGLRGSPDSPPTLRRATVVTCARSIARADACAETMATWWRGVCSGRSFSSGTVDVHARLWSVLVR